MSYFHVLADSGGGEDEILSDLTKDDLIRRFVAPYERGEAVFVDGKVIQTSNLCSVAIIETQRNAEVERDAINAKSCKEIDEFNRDSSVFLISVGRGYAPGDIREAGVDTTALFLNGPPGYARNRPSTPTATKAAIKSPMADSPSIGAAVDTSPAWWKRLALTVAAGIIVAGVVYYLGWN